MHVCTVLRAHPCFDKIATILARRHQRAQRTLQTKQPSYKILVTQKCRWSTEITGEGFNSHIMCPSNKSGSSSTQVMMCGWKCSRHLWISTFALTRLFYSAVSDSFHRITRLIHQSQRACKKAKTITSLVFFISDKCSTKKKLHCSGSV